ncbi:MAG: macro domain-containing protein [Anaerolineae bacterium]
MITYVTGDLFQSPAQVLVNTVNTVGVMGKGIALQFKRLFPDMYTQYRDMCEQGEFRVGMLWLYRTPNKWILNFPTKEHWRAPSRVEYIDNGLATFVNRYAEMGIHSIAFPPLGCGNGQLDFESQVRPIMERHLQRLPIEVFIHPNLGSQTPAEHEIPDDICAWLRSEPRALPFSEVWDDLRQLLQRESLFETVTGTQFEARISEEPPPGGLSWRVGGKSDFVSYDTLLALWQQLRSLGYSMRQTAPGISREMSYVMPVLARLPYVALVRLWDGYSSLATKGRVGLQVLPSAYRSPEMLQPALFEVSC